MCPQPPGQVCDSWTQVLELARVGSPCGQNHASSHSSWVGHILKSLGSPVRFFSSLWLLLEAAETLLSARIFTSLLPSNPNTADLTRISLLVKIGENFQAASLLSLSHISPMGKKPGRLSKNWLFSECFGENTVSHCSFLLVF